MHAGPYSVHGRHGHQVELGGVHRQTVRRQGWGPIEVCVTVHSATHTSAPPMPGDTGHCGFGHLPSLSRGIAYGAVPEVVPVTTRPHQTCAASCGEGFRFSLSPSSGGSYALILSKAFSAGGYSQHVGCGEVFSCRETTTSTQTTFVRVCFAALTTTGSGGVCVGPSWWGRAHCTCRVVEHAALEEGFRGAFLSAG